MFPFCTLLTGTWPELHAKCTKLVLSILVVWPRQSEISQLILTLILKERLTHKMHLFADLLLLCLHTCTIQQLLQPNSIDRLASGSKTAGSDSL